MCSCFPGYAIMADGVSCEGEIHGGCSRTCANLSWPVGGARKGDGAGRTRRPGSGVGPEGLYF